MLNQNPGPLHPATEHMFNKDMLSKMKRGAYLINTARGNFYYPHAIAKKNVF